ncbi:MAG: hypothetical protein FWF28_02890 [Micrococcales bacterium]|nr:hypothetical protein [Micrococcales bacterium]
MTTPTAVPPAPAEHPLPRSEYPRPDLDRSQRWLSLDGRWSFARSGPAPDEVRWDETIVVPFAWETPASGIDAHWLERAWYRRSFAVPPQWTGDRVILHFGAVHHVATVWLDGHEVGSHTGGYVPFEFDVTDLAAPGRPHELVVRVDAPNDKRTFPHGKQRSLPPDDYDSCAFTPSSGIWQPVWLEPRPATYLATLTLGSSRALDAITVRARVQGPHAETATITVAVADVAGATVTIDALTPDGRAPDGNAAALTDGVAIALPEPIVWEPGNPHLYPVTVEVHSVDGTDVVHSYAGVRQFEARGDQFWLNGHRMALRGVLDQGYWPTTGITAPDDQAFVADLELARDLGFTLVRKHLKLEDPRFLYHADRLGMLVWAEPPSASRFSDAAAHAFEEQIDAMVARDAGHPSIVIWGLYNEEWGLDWDLPGDPAKQAAVRRAVARLRHLDPTRPLVDNSGWAHVDTDLIDWHVYDEQPAGWAAKVRAVMGSTCPSFPVAIAVDRTVDKTLLVAGEVPADRPLLNSEFGGGYTPIDRGWNLHWQTQELRRYDRLAGYVWTELTDIEQETAGVADASRHVKDHGGRPPRQANANTVPVFGVTPIAPGHDLDAVGGVARLSLAVSHHGDAAATVDVSTAWGARFAAEPETRPEVAGTVTAAPFRLSASLSLACPLPPDPALRRLHVLLSDTHTGATVGHGTLDVAD